jgi:Family of unknown function (DUF6069)
MSSSGPAASRPAGAEAGTDPERPASGARVFEPTVSTVTDPSPASPSRDAQRRDAQRSDAASLRTTRVPWSTVALTAAIAVAGNLTLYLLAGATGTDLRAPMGEGGAIQDVPVLAVPIVSLVGVVAAAVALRVVQRLLPRRAWGAWLGLVGLGFVLSLAPMAAVPAESVPWLAAMHALVAVVVVILIGRRARGR